MVKFYTVSFIFIFHFILRLSIFFDPGKIPQTASDISSIIFMTTILLILTIIEMVPKRFQMTSTAGLVTLEIILSLMVLEAAVIILWSNVEKLVEYLLLVSMKAIPFLRGYKVRKILLDLILITISLSMWISCLIYTDTYRNLIEAVQKWKTQGNVAGPSCKQRPLKGNGQLQVFLFQYY